MPTVNTNVGGLAIPVPAGAASDPLLDPAVLPLLDYLAYWLRAMLNTKLASMGGTADVANQVYVDACPAANLFPYDPKQYWTHNPKPALYGWWGGPSIRRGQTIVYDVRERELQLMWVYSQLNGPAGDRARSGLAADVDAIFHRAHARGAHPSYGYNGAAPGTPIWKSMGVHSWEYVEGRPGALMETPSGSSRAGGISDGQAQTYYPAVMGRVIVRERIYNDTMVDPDDVNLDTRIAIVTNEEGDRTNLVEFSEIYLP